MKMFRKKRESIGKFQMKSDTQQKEPWGLVMDTSFQAGRKIR